MLDADTTGQPGPLSDDDTLDAIDEALTNLAKHRGRWLGDEHAQLHRLASPIEQAERFLPEAVITAGANGTSSSDIAHLLGISPNDAWIRFSPASPIADNRWPHNH